MKTKPLGVAGTLWLSVALCGCGHHPATLRHGAEPAPRVQPEQTAPPASLASRVETVWFKVKELDDPQPATNESLAEHGIRMRLDDDATTQDPGKAFAWRLHGVVADAPRPAERRAVVLFCDGNRGAADSRAPRLREIADEFNVTVMAFDYRGYGRSEGLPDETALAVDARAARRFLASRAGVAESSVVLMAAAVGAGVAAELAASDGCRGLVLENAVTSLGEVADAGAPPFLASHPKTKSRFDAEAALGRYEGPLLQTHGELNDVVPVAQGQRVFAAARGPKKWVTIPGGRHDDPPAPEFKAAFDEFLRYLPPEKRAADRLTRRPF